jgi:hypothetical protein
MKQITGTLIGIALSCCMISSAAQAVSIQSMTIEGIPVASGGVPGRLGGRVQSFFSDSTDAYGGTIRSSGSTDGALIMGSVQGNNAFSVFFADHDSTLTAISTLQGAPSGSIVDGVMSLDLSGFTAELSGGQSFNISPDNGSLSTSVSMVDAAHYYYTADWQHGTFYSSSFVWRVHLEGIATTVPVPEAETYAMMLAGLSLVGLMAHRRRRLV